MARFLIFFLLLTADLMASVELPLESESTTRRERRRKQDVISIPLEGVLVSEVQKEKVELPLPGEAVPALEPKKKSENDFEQLLSKLQALFRREVVKREEKKVVAPEPPRLKPLREPSRIGKFRSRMVPKKKKRTERPKVQVLGLPETSGQWIGPLPEGSRDWEKNHEVQEGKTVLRVRSWSRIDGTFRPFMIKVTPVLSSGQLGGEASSVRRVEEGRNEQILTLVRHHVYKVEVWAGEPLLAKSGYVYCTETHQDLIAEMLPWSTSSPWKPIALCVQQAEDFLDGLDLLSWRRAQVLLDLDFIAIDGNWKKGGRGGEVTPMSMQDLIGWCMTAPKHAMMLPWQTLGAMGECSLKVIGAIEPMKVETKDPSSWFSFFDRAKKNRGVVFVEGVSRQEEFDGSPVSPMALLLLNGMVPDGMILKDPEDWEFYTQLLSKGYRLSCLKLNERFWRGTPFGGDHLIQSEGGPRQHVEALRQGRVVVGEGCRVEFDLFDQPGGKAMAGVGDRLPYPSGNVELRLLPKLSFEVNDQCDGVIQVELWVGDELRQRTRLTRPLKRGEALFAFELFQPNDAVMAGLRMADGRFIFTNPIYIGRDSKNEKGRDVEIALPSSWQKGYLLLKEAGAYKELVIQEGETLRLKLPLETPLELWSDTGEVLRTSPLEVFWGQWVVDERAALKETPWEQYQAMLSFFPLEMNWGRSEGAKK